MRTQALLGAILTVLLQTNGARSAQTTRTTANDLAFERKKVVYDSFSIPPKGQHSAGQDGDITLLGIFKKLHTPCVDCMITYMEAHLEHADGSRADFDTGMWMHHIVLLNRGRKERVCRSGMERFFFSGNERTPFDFAKDHGQKRVEFGYYLDPAEEEDGGLMLYADFMNEKAVAQNVTFAMTWEYTTDPDLVQNMRRAEPYWLDVAPQCSDSDVPNHDHTEFSYTGGDVPVDTAGQVALSYGHVHEAGESLTVRLNNNTLCDVQVSHKDKADKDGIAHLQHIPSCRELGNVEKGDALSVTVKYDTNKHKPMRTPKGELEPAMGVAIAWIIPDTELQKEIKLPGPEPAISQDSTPLQSHAFPAIAVVAGMTICVGGVYRWLRKRRTRRSNSNSKVYQYTKLGDESI